MAGALVAGCQGARSAIGQESMQVSFCCVAASGFMLARMEHGTVGTL